MAAHVSAVRALYKRILVLHRFLPLDLKALGDQYVKDEFRRHRGAEPGEAGRFMEEWTNYRDTLQTQVLEARLGPARFGLDIAEDRLPDFQDQQIGQLYELLLEASKPNRQFNIQDD